MASSPIIGKIDVHNHFVPPSYAQGSSSTKNGTQHLELMADTTTAVADAGGDPSGWQTPAWTTDSAKELMQKGYRPQYCPLLLLEWKFSKGKHN
jgi:hypothetical protein